MPGVLLASRRSRRPVDIDQRQGPDPTFLETIDASIRASADAEGGDTAREREAIDKIYGDVVDQLDRQGLANPAYVRRDITNLFQRSYDDEAIWQGIARARARNPQAFANLPKSQAEFADWATADVRRETAARADRAARGSGVARTLGSLAYGASDPVNVATIPIGIGGAKTIGGAILQEGIFNAKIEALQTPVTAIERAKRGESYGVDQALVDIGTAGVTGGLLGGAGKTAEKFIAPVIGRATSGAGTVIASGREAALAKIYDVLPDALKQRWASAADIRETDLPDIAEAVVGRDNMSADERAAADLIRREGEIAAANPFEANGAGVAAHQEGFAEALATVMGRAPLPSARARLGAGTSIGGGVGGGIGRSIDTGFLPARDALKARIRAVESSGNDSAASGAGAVGRYQFLASTWLRYYKRRFGDGESDAAILAKRTDGGLQETLVDDLLADNAAFLRRQGEAETAGNLYLLHFAGPGNARKLFDLPPETPATSIFSRQAIKFNPFLRDMTAGDVIAWAHRKMNEPAPPRAGARTVIAGGGREAADVQAELDRIAAERQALQGQADAIAGEAPPLPEAPPVAPRLPEFEEPLPAPINDAIDPPPAPTTPPVEAPPAAAPLARETVDAVQSYVRGEGSMIPANIAKQIGLPEADVVRALQGMASREGGGVKMTRYGKFRRAPSEGPMDLLKFIARNGGLRDDEGHMLARYMEMQKFVPGAGMLIRKEGMSLDRARELAAEAGYFHDRDSADAFSNTTEADFLELLDSARSGDHYSLFDEAAITARDAERAMQAERVRAQVAIDEKASTLGIAPDRALSRRAVDLAVENGLDSETALVRAINERFQEAMDAAAEIGSKDRYAQLADDFAALSPDGARGNAPDSGGPGAAAGAAGRSGDAAGYGDAPRPATDGIRPAGGRADADAALTDNPPGNEAAAAPFRDPDGAAVVQQADSLWHDLEAAVDPAIAAREAETARLGAEAPMQPKVDQDSTIGAPLFDAVDQGSFATEAGTVRTDLPMRLDPDGPEIDAAGLVEKLNREEAELKAIRDCL